MPFNEFFTIDWEAHSVAVEKMNPRVNTEVVLASAQGFENGPLSGAHEG